MGTSNIRISSEIYNQLKELRGHNGCRTFDDVLQFLIKNYITSDEFDAGDLE